MPIARAGSPRVRRSLFPDVECRQHHVGALLLRARLGRGSKPLAFAQFGNVVESLADRDFEVLQIDRLGHEVEGGHGSSSAQIGHVAVRRDDDRLHRRLLFTQPASRVSPPPMTGMLMSSNIRSISGSAASAASATLRAVDGYGLRDT